MHINECESACILVPQCMDACAICNIFTPFLHWNCVYAGRMYVRSYTVLHWNGVYAGGMYVRSYTVPTLEWCVCWRDVCSLLHCSYIGMVCMLVECMFILTLFQCSYIVIVCKLAGCMFLHCSYIEMVCSGWDVSSYTVSTLEWCVCWRDVCSFLHCSYIGMVCMLAGSMFVLTLFLHWNGV